MSEPEPEMPSKWQVVKWLSISLVVLFSTAFVLELAGIQWYKYFGKKWRSAEREVYEENKSFVDAKLDTLRDRWMKYKEADEEQKQTICLTVEQEFEDFDASKVKIDEMRYWLKDIQTEGC